MLITETKGSCLACLGWLGRLTCWPALAGVAGEADLGVLAGLAWPGRRPGSGLARDPETQRSHPSQGMPASSARPTWHGQPRLTEAS